MIAMAFVNVRLGTPSRPPHARLTFCTRGPVSASIHRISAGATKCHVGRSTCVLRMCPASNVALTAASVTPAVRIARAHFAPWKSWACTAPSHETTSSTRAGRPAVRR